MSATLVQHKSTKGVGVTSVSCTFTTTPVAGNNVVVGGSGWGRSWNSTAVTDNKSNTYTRREFADATNVHCGLFEATNIASSATFTVHGGPTGTANDTDIAIHEYSAPQFVFDVGASSFNNSPQPTYDTGTTATTTQADELAFAVFTSESMSGFPTVSSGYTKLESIITTTNMPIVTAAQALSATGAQDATLSTDNFSWAACIATYKTGSVGGSGAPVSRNLIVLQAVNRAATY